MYEVYKRNTLESISIDSTFRQCITDRFMKSIDDTVAVIGKDDSGNIVTLDIEKAPHVLVAGTTGSGKSVMLHNILASLLLKNSLLTARFLIIDPKMVEFSYFYKNHPLLWRPVVTDPADALNALLAAQTEMMNRYDIMSSNGERFWKGKKLYIFIDEIADLINVAGKPVEKVIASIARLGRGAGCHLILATQHPVSTVLNRQITANIDTRIGLRVDDGTASRLVIRASGCEYLKGKGDAILRNADGLQHFQGAYLSDSDLIRFAHSYRCEKRSLTRDALKGIINCIKLQFEETR